MYSGICMFVWVWICLHICPAKETFRPQILHSGQGSCSVYFSCVYMHVVEKTQSHCITLQLQLDAIQWPCLFPYDSQWLCSTSNSYVILNFSIYLFQSLNVMSTAACHSPWKINDRFAHTISDTNHVLSDHKLCMTANWQPQHKTNKEIKPIQAHPGRN